MAMCSSVHLIPDVRLSTMLLAICALLLGLAYTWVTACRSMGERCAPLSLSVTCFPLRLSYPSTSRAGWLLSALTRNGAGQMFRTYGLSSRPAGRALLTGRTLGIMSLRCLTGQAISRC